MMIVKLFQFWEVWHRNGNFLFYANFLRYGPFSLFYIITIIIKSSMMSSYRLGNKWCYLRIHLLYYLCTNICMNRTSLNVCVFLIISCNSLNIFLPFYLLLAFIMQLAHDKTIIFHAKFVSEFRGKFCNTILMVFI